MTPAFGSVVVDAAIVAGFVGLAVTLLLVAIAAMARWALVVRQRRLVALEAIWSPLMLQSLRGDLGDVPPLRRRQRAHVLGLWVQLAESLAGDGRDRLVRFARHARLDDDAIQVLGGRNPVARTVAAAVSGRLRDTRAWSRLIDLTRSPNVIERSQAAKALVMIDAVDGLAEVVPLLAEWDDCHPATASKILADAPADVSAPVIAGAALAARGSSAQARLVRVLATLRHPAGLEAARRLLASSDDPEVVAGCLQIVADHREPVDAELVRRSLGHPASFVRVQAVTALGRLRGRGDEWRIVGMLSDSDWWVRYRAAQALLAMPSMERTMVERLGDVLPDRYARGALRQALTESRVVAA